MFSFVAKRALGSAKDSVKDSSATDNSGGVNWQEFNYPPCITVVHFDPEGDAIPKLAKDTVKRMKLMWYYGCCILIFNLCSSIGFVADGSDAGVIILYSCLQLAAGSGAGGAALYQGYRGVAGDLPRNSRIYLGCQGLLTVLMIVFASIQSGNVHGFAGTTSRTDTASQPAYTVMCILEGTMWLVCMGFSLYCMFRVWRYPGHDRATRTEAATSKNEKEAKKRTRHNKESHDHHNEDINLSQGKKSKKSRAPPADDVV